jgi:hypothetical protein
MRGNSHVRFGAGDEETCLGNGARRFIPTLPESSAYLSLSRSHLKDCKMRWKQNAATIVTPGAETLCGSARKHMLASRA